MEDGSPSEVTDSRKAFGVSSGEMAGLRLDKAWLAGQLTGVFNSKAS